MECQFQCVRRTEMAGVCPTSCPGGPDREMHRQGHCFRPRRSHSRSPSKQYVSESQIVTVLFRTILVLDISHILCVSVLKIVGALAHPISQISIDFHATRWPIRMIMIRVRQNLRTRSGLGWFEAQIAMATAGNAVVIMDAEARIFFASPLAQLLLGPAGQELAHEPWDAGTGNDEIPSSPSADATSTAGSRTTGRSAERLALPFDVVCLALD